MDQEIHFEPIIRLKVKSELKDQSIWSREFQIWKTPLKKI